MSPSMLKMWISFAGMILLILAIGLIWLSRYKLKGLLSGVVSVLAYVSLILGGLIILYIVFSGPTGQAIKEDAKLKFVHIRIAGVLLITVLLSGCLYPENELNKNEAPNESQLELVQSAVDQYREDKQGLVPIKTKGIDTPIFQKYLVDFTVLKENNLLAEIPGNAYENGGVYQYVLLTPEEDPQVKLIDLRITEDIRRVNVQLDIYRDKNLYPPFGEKIAEGLYTIDYKKLGFDTPPTVTSPYTKENLPIVMDSDGKLYIDYRIDLTNALELYENNYQEGDDIRYLLADNTPFLPAYSLPYTVHDGEPVFLQKKK